MSKIFSDEIKNVPYPLPEGWRWVKFSSIIDWSKPYPMKRGPFGGAIKKSSFVPKGDDTYKVYEQKHAINKDATIGTYYISKSKYEELKAFSVSPGDAIISCSGTIGKVFILPQDIEQGIINQALLKITLNHDLILPSFFVYLFETYLIKMGGIPKSQGMAIKNIPGVKILKEILIPLPTLEQQKQIVEKIEAIFEKIDKARTLRQKALEDTKKLFESVLNKIFKEAEENKENWKWVKLEEISEKIKPGGTPSTKIKRYWAHSSSNIDYENVFPWLDINKDDFENIFIDRYRKTITKEGLNNSNAWLVPKNSILITIGGSLGLVGINKIPITTNQNILSVVLKKEFFPNFVAHYLRFKYPKWLKNLIGYKNLAKRDEIKRMVPIPTKNNQPDLEKQKQIAQYLDNLHNKIKQLEELQKIQLEKFKQLKESILNKAFKGELV